ncbi:DMT family transporter [Oceanispirochaeta sp.]|uniref:DMT family transporter n=1 Tax=Oceanispirochaeta sp. TaxID=2035350 RepID=UPI00261D7342|nr:DMT family transporter [Oceanispirochaeta sp.]MDA3958303.1 DMT family transporter [Oceanispirochaeta sp.]
MRNHKNTGILQAFMAFSLGGSTVVAAKLLTGRIPLFLCCFLSMATGLLILIPLQLKEWQVLKSLTKKEIGNIFLQGFSGMLLFRVFTILGLQYTSAASAGLITSSGPAVMALLSMFFLKEKPGNNKILALVLTILSLILINTSSGESIRFSYRGNGLILLAVLCECGMTLIRKSHGRSIPALTNTTVLVLACLLISFPMALWELSIFPLSMLAPRDWIVLLYYGLFPTAAGYLLWASGVMKIPGSMAGVTMAAAPLSALVLSVLILKERLQIRHWISGILVVAALLLGNRESGTLKKRLL